MTGVPPPLSSETVTMWYVLGVCNALFRFLVGLLRSDMEASRLKMSTLT